MANPLATPPALIATGQGAGTTESSRSNALMVNLADKG
jgi:hypothetical protein